MVARSLFNGGQASVISSTNRNQASQMAGGGISNGGTDCDRYHYRAARPFTWERFYARGTSTIGADRSATWYQNGTSVVTVGPLTNSILASAEDLATTVSVAQNDVLAMSIDRTSTSSLTGIATRSVLKAPGDRAITPLMSAAITSGTSSNAVVKATLGGALAMAATTLEAISHVTRFGGTWCGLYAYVISNTGAAAQLVAYKNDVATAMMLSIGIGESGMFSDMVNEVEFVLGDKLDIREDGPAGNTIAVSVVGSSLISEDKKSELYGYGARNIGITAGTPRAVAIAGGDPGTPGTDLVAIASNIGFHARLSKLRGYCLNVSAASTVTVTLHVNEVATALTFDVPFGVAAYTKYETADGVYVDVGPLDRLSLVYTTDVTFASGFNQVQRCLMLEDLTNDAEAVIALESMTGAGAITNNQGVVLSQDLGAATLSAQAATAALQVVLAKTLDSISLGSAIIAAPLTVVLAKTLGAVTLSAQATMGQNVALAKTLGAATLSSAMGAPLNVVLAQTLGSIALAGVATAGDRVTLTKTLGAATLAAQATADQGLTLVRTLGAVTLAAQASTPVGAVLSAVLAPMVLSGAVSSPLAATLAKTLGAMTLLGSVQAPLSVTLAKTLGGLILGATVRLERTYRRRYLSWLVY